MLAADVRIDDRKIRLTQDAVRRVVVVRAQAVAAVVSLPAVAHHGTVVGHGARGLVRLRQAQQADRVLQLGQRLQLDQADVVEVERVLRFVVLVYDDLTDVVALDAERQVNVQVRVSEDDLKVLDASLE
jgi:hypothetical protein